MRSKRAAATAASAALLAACAAASGDVFPPTYIPDRPNAADWPDAGAAVLEDVATLEFKVLPADEKAKTRATVVAVLDHRRRIKILSEAGLPYAEVRLLVDGYSTITEVQGRAVHADRSTTPMSATDVRQAALPGVGDKTGEVKNLVFNVPGAEVGGLIEYRYTRLYLDPDFVPVWVFGGPLPVVHAEFGIVARDNIRVDYRYGVGESSTDRLPLRRRLDDGAERLVFVENDLPAFYPEPDMPNLSRIAPWLAVVMTRAQVGKAQRRLETWQDVGTRLTDLFDEVDGPKGKGSAAERFAAVRDQVTGIELLGLGVRRPVAAPKIAAGDPVCTRDAAALLLDAMQGVSSKVYPAFLTAADGPPAADGLPGLYPFVRAVVAVDVKEEVAADLSCRADPVKRGVLCTVPPNSYAFLDPLCKGCRFGELPTELTGGRALVLLDGGPRWVDVPEDPPERNRTFLQVQLAMDVDGTFKGESNGELAGDPARRLRRTLGDAARGEERDAALAAALVGNDPALKLSRGTYANASRLDRPLSFKAHAEGKADKVRYGHYRLRPLDIAGPSLPGGVRKTRSYAAVLHAPAWLETAVVLDLPVGFSVALPPTARIVEPFAEYAAGFVRRERTLNYSRRLVVKQHVINAKEWPAFVHFVEQVEALENQALDLESGE